MNIECLGFFQLFDQFVKKTRITDPPEYGVIDTKSLQFLHDHLTPGC